MLSGKIIFLILLWGFFSLQGYAQLSHAGNDSAPSPRRFTFSHGAIVRGDSTRKEIALVFTGDQFGDGLLVIASTLEKRRIPGSFFFTGRFYRNPAFRYALIRLYDQHHYLGPHSNDHLLYNDWNKRDSLLVTQQAFASDLQRNLDAMRAQGIDTGASRSRAGLRSNASPRSDASPRYFIPPYEWWNDQVAAWSKAAGFQLVSFTPGIHTNADYTYPEMGASYKSSDWILQSVKQFQADHPGGLNGAIILIHAGVDPRRRDKLYDRLDELITWLQSQRYRFLRVDELLADSPGQP